MTTHEVRVEAVAKGHAEIRAKVIRGAESWQFFAFVFAATVTFLLAVIEEFPLSRVSLLRLGVKVLAFAVMGYVTLFSPRGRNWLAGLLGKFKEEG